MPSLSSLQQWQPAARPCWGHRRGPCPSRPCLAVPVTPSPSSPPPALPPVWQRLGGGCQVLGSMGCSEGCSGSTARQGWGRTGRPRGRGADLVQCPRSGMSRRPLRGSRLAACCRGRGCPCCPCCPCCPPAARLLVSFTWIPSRSDWKHPGTTLPMRIASVPAGEVSSSKESNWERAQVTARNLLVFI